MSTDKPVCRIKPDHGPSHHRGLCGRCYNLLRALHGQWSLVDSGPVLKRIARLRDLGWTWPDLADRAGLGETTVWTVWKTRPARVRPDTARGILAVPLVVSPSKRGVDSTGSRRRVQALAWMGWTAPAVAVEAGISPSSIATLISPGRRISGRNAAAIAAVYARWSHVEGPSRLAAAKARARGYPPPAAWDEDTIDDPSAAPQWGAWEVGTAWEEVPHLRSLGLSDHEIATKLGVAVGSLKAWDSKQRAS